MRSELLEKISQLTDEEKRILSGEELDKKFYTAENDFIINDKRLTKGARAITMRTHPRYTPFPPHKHTFAEMMLVFSGSITHEVGGKRITLTAGDILLLNKHVTHSIELSDTADVGMNIIISDKFADSLSPRLDGTVFSSFFKENSKRDGAESYLCFRTGDFPEISNVTENLIAEFLEETPDEFIIKETISLLFYHLSKKRETLLDIESGARDKESFRRLEILSYVKSNYRSATLGELAKRLYVSEPYLSKLVSVYFGKSFKELLLEERMRRAERLLTESDMPVGKIIYTLGYENESYFHTQFKKRYGKTPLNLRKEAEAKKEKK